MNSVRSTAAGEGLDGDEAGVNGVVRVGDELEFEAGGLLGDGGHTAENICPQQIHRQMQACSSVVMIRAHSPAIILPPVGRKK
jgi:hypothetical protein